MTAFEITEDDGWFAGDLIEQRQPVTVNGLHGYMRAEAGNQDLLFPDVHLYLRVEPSGIAEDVTSQVIASVRTAPDAPEIDLRSPFLVSLDGEVLWIVQGQRRQMFQPQAGQGAVSVRSGQDQLSENSSSLA